MNFESCYGKMEKAAIARSPWVNSNRFVIGTAEAVPYHLFSADKNVRATRFHVTSLVSECS